MEKDSLTIRELAAKTSVPSKTLRYWESRRLLPQPSRTYTGYREYPISAVRRVEFIKKAKGIGFSLSEILWLMSVAKQRGSTCQVVNVWAEKKLEVLDQQIRALTRLRKELEQRRRNWRGRLPCPPLTADEICCLIEELPSPQTKVERR